MAHPHQSGNSQILIYGVMSIALYFLLYQFADVILELSKQGHWYFSVPIVIAFIFSFVHGHFTGHFWDILGIKAKQMKKS